MSETDSFIDEVTEEVRRDQLFQYLRRYGWIAVAAVLVLVGGTAYREYALSRQTAAAQATGDAILAAMETEGAAERAAALSAIETSGGASAITGLLAASDLESSGDSAGAAALLDQVAADADVPQLYRDLAALKSVMVQGSDLDIETRRATLTGLSQPGATFRMIALEQLALAELETGDSEAAIAQFRAIAQDAETTEGLRNRALAMIVALGGEVDDLAGATGQ